MQIQRLFNVLVLGGAALGVACGDGPTSEEEGPETASGGASPGTTGATGGAVNDGAGGDVGGSVGGFGGDDATGGAGAGGAGAGAGGPLVCSDEPNPADACGCPCCWADCPNTDAECCSGFCESGNDGQGCCGL